MSEMKASNTSETLQPKLNVKLPNTGNAAVDAPTSSTISQVEIDRETTLLRLENEKLKHKRELLELEKLSADIAKIRASDASSSYVAETVQESLKYQIEASRAIQEACNHRKGGEAVTLLGGAPSMGSDGNNYAMIQHTFTSGVVARFCLRCPRSWFPQDPDYKWAMSRPTRNSPSTGSPSPGLTKHPERVRLVSEIPHRPIANPEVQFNTDGPQGY